MVAAERLEKIAGEGHVIGNGFRDLIRIDEVCRLAVLAVGRVDEGDARIIEDLLELQRILPILLDVVRVRLDALQSQRGDPFDRPHDVVLPAPDGTGGPEKNVRIDGVERLMRNRAPHSGWPADTRRGHRGAGPKTGPDELTAIQHSGLLNERA